MTASGSPHREPGWDMHDRGPELHLSSTKRLLAGEKVNGEVVCHHPFGLGLYLAGVHEYGHVNVTEIDTGQIRGPQDFPAVGDHVSAVALGYTDTQLRLSLARARQSG